MKSFVMRQLLAILILQTILSTCKAQQEGDFVLAHVNVVTMRNNRVLLDQNVVIRNGRVQAIRAAGKKHISSAIRVVDCTGKYLIPGLAEMHAHIPPVDDIAPMKNVLMLFLANGVTTIRGMLGHPLHLELRKKVEDGSIPGPRIITSGPSFNGNSVTSPEQAANMVREQKTAGYDFLKLHPGLLRDEFLSIAQTAREIDIPFAGHVSFDVGVSLAIQQGYATIDHMDGFVEYLVPGVEHMKENEMGFFGSRVADHADTSRIPQLMNALKQQNIWVVPTEALSRRWFSPYRSAIDFAADPEMAYVSKNTLNSWIKSKNDMLSDPQYDRDKAVAFMELRKKLIAAMQQYGVGILLGSDAPQVFDVPGFSAHQELQYYVDAGLSPFQALQTGTVNVGRFLKRDDMGTIRTGATADLVLLEGNPLESISNTTKIAGVVKEGKWYPRDYLDKQLERIRIEYQQ